MRCPRCKSLRIQLGYKDKSILALLGGGVEFLCNNCGKEFKSFDLLNKAQRAPAKKAESTPNRRRAPRYKAHLPATIRLAKKHGVTGKLILSTASRGHCVTISKLGVELSFIGSRFGDEEFQAGQLFFVTILLPNETVDMVVTTVSHDRVGLEKGTKKRLVGATITQISEADNARLMSYLDKRGNEEPLFVLE
jgi:hypothetical protein